MQAFIGAQGDEAGVVSQGFIVGGGQGLLDHLHPQPLEFRREAVQAFDIQPLIGVDHKPGLGRSLAHRLKPGEVVGTAYLQLQHRPARCGPRRLGHLFRRVETEGETGFDRADRRLTGQGPDARARKLGLQIPKGAVKGVAGRAGRQAAGEVVAAKPLGDIRG